MVPNCREVQNLLPLFFDSELDSRQMRAVALHSARCPSCETQLRELEAVQEAVARTVNEGVEDIDLGTLWPAIEPRLRPAQPPLRARWRLWREERQPIGGLGGALVGAAAVGFAIALVTLQPAPPSGAPALAQSPAGLVENAVSIDSIDSASDIALLKEADALVLWLDEDPAPASEPVNWENR